MGLEDHVHQVGHLDDFAVGKAKTFVVVQDCVHVFNPISVYRTVENDPLPLALGVLISASSENTANNAVLELLRNEVIASVELLHRHRLRVNHVALCLELLK